MQSESTRRRRLLGVVSVSIVLAACGGGGGDDGGDGGSGIDDEDATGIWAGTLKPDGEAQVPAFVVAVPDGSFALMAPGQAFLYGTGSTDGDSFTADATGYAFTGATFANGSTSGSFTLTGTVFEEDSLTGSYSGAGESGTIAMDFDATRTNRAASLSLVAGSYSATVGTASTSLSVNNGALTFNATTGTNCVGNGTIRLADTSSRNLYQWTMTLTGCPSNGQFEGVAFLADVGGGSNNQLLMLGAGASGPLAVAFAK